MAWVAQDWYILHAPSVDSSLKPFSSSEIPNSLNENDEEELLPNNLMEEGYCRNSSGIDLAHKDQICSHQHSSPDECNRIVLRSEDLEEMPALCKDSICDSNSVSNILYCYNAENSLLSYLHILLRFSVLGITVYQSLWDSFDEI